MHAPSLLGRLLLGIALANGVLYSAAAPVPTSRSTGTPSSSASRTPSSQANTWGLPIPDLSSPVSGRSSRKGKRSGSGSSSSTSEPRSPWIQSPGNSVQSQGIPLPSSPLVQSPSQSSQRSTVQSPRRQPTMQSPSQPPAMPMAPSSHVSYAPSHAYPSPQLRGQAPQQGQARSPTEALQKSQREHLHDLLQDPGSRSGSSVGRQSRGTAQSPTGNSMLSTPQYTPASPSPSHPRTSTTVTPSQHPSILSPLWSSDLPSLTASFSPQAPRSPSRQLYPPTVPTIVSSENPPPSYPSTQSPLQNGGQFQRSGTSTVTWGKAHWNGKLVDYVDTGGSSYVEITYGRKKKRTKRVGPWTTTYLNPGNTWKEIEPPRVVSTNGP